MDTSSMPDVNDNVQSLPYKPPSPRRRVSSDLLKGEFPYSFTAKLQKRLSKPNVFSNVFSTTGLGLPWVAREEEVSDQAAMLCKEFIQAKLRRLGLTGVNPKNGLRGARGQKISAVCREIQLIGTELERLYPTLYKDITKQLNMNLSSEQIAEQVLFDIGDVLFKTGITWAKIVALFVISASLSIECLQQGNGIFVHSIPTSLTSYVNAKLVRWIAQRGGWVDLLRTFRRKRNDSNMMWMLTIGAVFLGFFLVTVLTSRSTYLRMWSTKTDPEQ